MFKKIKNLFDKKTSKSKEEKPLPVTEKPEPSKSDESGVDPKESDKKPKASVSEGETSPAEGELEESRPALKASKEKPEKSQEQTTPPLESTKPTAVSKEGKQETQPTASSEEQTIPSPESETKSEKTDTEKETSEVVPQKEKSSDPEPQAVSKEEKVPERESIKLQGLFAFKMAMTSLYDEQGRRVPVTALKYEPWIVSQIKTKEKEGYSAAQLACRPQKNNRSTRPLIKHLTPAGFKEGARFIREIRQELPEEINVGQQLSIESLKKGDRVRISSRSKGRGFSGVVKRWGFRGGSASHGSKTHRTPGSIGQCAEPARVMPGRKMPGQYGFKTVTLNSVPVVDVLPKEGMIFVKGPVSGARNTLVSLKKVETAHA